MKTWTIKTCVSFHVSSVTWGHLVSLKAQVWIQDEAGGQVIVLTQLLGSHSRGGHIAPLCLQTGCIKPCEKQTQMGVNVHDRWRSFTFININTLNSLRLHRRLLFLLWRRDVRCECWERVWLTGCSLVNLFPCRLPFNTMFLDSPSHFMPTSPLVQLHLVSEMKKHSWVGKTGV